MKGKIYVYEQGKMVEKKDPNVMELGAVPQLDDCMDAITMAMESIMLSDMRSALGIRQDGRRDHSYGRVIDVEATVTPAPLYLP